MLFKLASGDLRPSLHQQMKFNPASHNPVTAYVPCILPNTTRSNSSNRESHPKEARSPLDAQGQCRTTLAAQRRAHSKAGGKSSVPGEAPARKAKAGPAGVRARLCAPKLTRALGGHRAPRGAVDRCHRLIDAA